ncbi:MAG TPA: hypothetical protein H9969_00005 [Candidatus Barnesiella merdipullorum]|nr:hypothetical protein [Candidatus Barnesiella merdipullorum]
MKNNLLKLGIAIVLILATFLLGVFVQVIFLDKIGIILRFVYLAFIFVILKSIWTSFKAWNINNMLASAIPLALFIYLSARGGNFSEIGFYYGDIIGMILVVGYISYVFYRYIKSSTDHNSDK